MPLLQVEISSSVETCYNGDAVDDDDGDDGDDNDDNDNNTNGEDDDDNNDEISCKDIVLYTLCQNE